MSNTENLKGLSNKLNNILKGVALDNVTAESTGYENLPDGYYLCEVESAELKTSKSSGEPMVALQLKVSEDGIDVVVNDDGPELSEIKKTKNRKVFMYYVLKDEKSVKRFVADMLKFEGDEEGTPLLEKEYFTTSEVLEDALEILEGNRIYVHVSTSTNDTDGSESTWTNIVSWKRAVALELPVN